MAVRRALVVEDDPGAQRLMKMLLVRLGFEVDVVDDGLSALEYVGGHPPDLVVLDLGLPHISGYDVVEGIRSSPAARHVPILVTTGHRLPQKQVMALQLGANAYLVKPFTRREFAAAVQALAPAGSARLMDEAR